MKTIQEFLIDILRSTQLYEMAENQSNCEKNVKSQIRNILENLTLINYFNISGLPTTNINHWKSELSSAIYNAADFNIKKDRSIGRRQRIVKRSFEDRDAKEYKNILWVVLPKFVYEKETQSYNDHFDEWLDQAILRTINQLDVIIELIVNKNVNQIRNWIKEL